jgi:hypothetical protein
VGKILSLPYKKSIKVRALDAERLFEAKTKEKTDAEYFI